MAPPLAECVLPGVNLAFGAAYPLMVSLCMSMFECKSIALRVLNRFKLLWDLMLKKETDPKNAVTLAALLSRFIEAFAAFWSFLGVYQKKNLIARLVESRVVMKTIIDFHQAIDKMILEINPELEQELFQWREQNRIDWEQQRSDMKAQLDDARAMGDALKDGGLAEMLTILKYETRHRQNETEPNQITMLEAAISRLEFTAQMTIEEVPRWFIPPYEVKYANPEELEEGTFGKVTHCTIMSGARAIIKLMLEDSDAARKRFLSEATIWKSLDYPHVIRLYNICHVGKPTFFVCEDAEGGNFADYFKAKAHRGSMWRLFHEASLGLLFLHDKKIVHGNLKCNNLLIGADGKAKISDFGFAFHRSASRALIQKTQVEGVRWKSPECLRGDEENPNFKSDVFSFGLCIIEAFTNEVPWGPAATDDNITDAAFSMQGPARPEGMSDNVWSLVESMVRSDPDVRITMSEAKEGLLRLLQTESEAETEVPSKFVELYELDPDGAQEWRSQWEEDIKNHELFFNNSLDMLQANANLLEKELADQQTLEEALILLMFECNNRDSNYSKEESELIHQVFGHVKRMSTLSIPSVPEWFVPPHHVELSPHTIGRGASASVHRGEWKRAFVAIKCVSPGNGTDIDSFKAEANIWSKLQHPHIVKLFGACHVGNRRRHKYDKVKTWTKLHEAALGLLYLHQTHKVVHGDLKCNNILVGDDGKAKIADFGLSFVIDANTPGEISDQEIGAISWKAPEIIDKKTRGTFASDVYSFGMCILEAVKKGIPLWGTMPDITIKHLVVKEATHQAENE